MKEFAKNPFFYLSFILIILLGFQVAQFVRAAFVEPTEPFPGGNPPTPLDTSGSDQVKAGSIYFPGLGAAGVKVGGGTIVTDNGVVLFAKESNGVQTPALLLRDSFNNSALYFGSGGNLFINTASGRQAAAITSGASPSTALTTGFNLDFNGSVNAGSLCISGDCKTAWSQVGGGSVTGQWTVSGNDIRYSAGNVIVDKYVFEDQSSYPDALTQSAAVCVDDRPGLIYEKSAGGTIARLYVSGTNQAGTWGVGCGNDPGPGQANQGKVLFLSWDWAKTSDPIVRIVLGDVNNPSLFSLATTYNVNTPTDTRVLAGRVYTAGGAQNPNLVLSVSWFKSRRPSYKQSYLAGNLSEEVDVMKSGLRLNQQNEPLPPCPGPGNINVGLLWVRNSTLQACSNYSALINEVQSTVLGWHEL